MNVAAHGQWKQNMLHGELLSGKWDTFACEHPGVWAGLWGLEEKVTLTHLLHGPPFPTLWLWDTSPEAAGDDTGALRGTKEQGRRSPSAQRNTQHTGPQTATHHTTYDGENETSGR